MSNANPMFFNNSYLLSNSSSIITDYGYNFSNDDNSSPIFDLFLEDLNRLHRHLTLEDLEKAQLRFLRSHDQKLDRRELRGLLAKFNIYFDDEKFETLFLKINTDRDDLCNWDEFISFLISLYQNEDPSHESLERPIEGAPVIKTAIHRHTIVKIEFCPNVTEDRIVDYTLGGYLTASEDGTVNFWSMNWAFQRSGQAKNLTLKVAKTLIIDCVCMPDVRVICTSSAERDLRFYDFTANNFVIRMVISQLPDYVSCMFYYFSKNENENSKLLLGDGGGNVRIIELSPKQRGPFQSKTEISVVRIKYVDLLNRRLPSMSVTEHIQVHADVVRQIGYFEKINSFISVAQCPPDTSEAKLNQCTGLIIGNMGIQKSLKTFHVNRGMNCFAFDEKSSLLATGGPDTILRLWSPEITKKPKAILSGHHAGINFIFIQDGGKLVYSLDKVKVIKVWQVRQQTLLQTYTHLQSTLLDLGPVKGFYNDFTRELITFGSKISLSKCRPRLNLLLNDGDTHSRPVTVVLFNELFQLIVTCGQDSFIITWDPWTGTRKNLIKNAHTSVVHGKRINIQITAGCFDPKHQLLLTGARDGTIKIWNFSNGFCMRNLSIEHMCEVTAVFWVPDRILAVGWNRHVSEFADRVEETDFGIGKSWDICHTDEILSAAVLPPQVLATGSRNGELVLWTFETGIPYRRYNVADPQATLQIVYDSKKKSAEKSLARRSSTRFYSKYDLQKQLHDKMQRRMTMQDPKSSMKPNLGPRQISLIPMPSHVANIQNLSINAMIFLDKRPMTAGCGTLLTALSDGSVLVWSHHVLGGYVDRFNAIHKAGDCVVAMTIDKKNKFLFTGTAQGYIKTWLILNCWTLNASEIKINHPVLRLKFPFLWKDVINGRAKRTARDQPKPLLLNSYKAHTKSLTGLTYVDQTQILFSSSIDKSVRMWALSGQYIGTVGSPVVWPKINSEVPIGLKYLYRLPPDIRRECSFTTMKVLKGGEVQRFFGKQKQASSADLISTSSMIKTTNFSGKLLGKHFKLPTRGEFQEKPVLSTNYRYIPVFKHLPLQKYNAPKIPENSNSLRK